MKKILALLLTIAVCSITAAARDTISRNVADLPAKAQQTLSKNFPKQGVNHIKIDRKTFGGADYDVILNNGTEIDFNSDGEWTEVDCGKSAVPSGFVIKPIADYVKKNYPKQKIVTIEKNRNNYELELSNGVDLKFDRSGNFQRIDD